jgi:hypothetical protein
MIAQACNPSYSGGKDQENHDVKPALAKSSRDPHLHQYLGMVVCTCLHPSSMGMHKWRTVLQAGQRPKMRPHLC